MTSLSDHLLRLPAHVAPPAGLWERIEARLDDAAREATAHGAERGAPPPALAARRARPVPKRRGRGAGAGQALAALVFCGLVTGTGAWTGGQAGEAALRQQVATYASASAALERQVQAGPAALVTVSNTADLAEDASEPLSAYWVRDEIATIDARLARHPPPAAAAALWRQRNEMLETWLALADPNPEGASLDA